jgi:hypothetical protein
VTSSSDPKNYESAIERVHAIAQMLGVNIAKQGKELALLVHRKDEQVF